MNEPSALFTLIWSVTIVSWSVIAGLIAHATDNAYRKEEKDAKDRWEKILRRHT